MHPSQSSIPLAHESPTNTPNGFFHSISPSRDHSPKTPDPPAPASPTGTLIGNREDPYERVPSTPDFPVKVPLNNFERQGIYDQDQELQEKEGGNLFGDREEVREFKFPPTDQSRSQQRFSDSRAGPSPHSHTHSRVPSYQGSLRSLWNIAPLVLGTSLACFFGILLLAGLHHGFYEFLDEKNVNQSVDPSISSKIGTGLSVVAKIVAGFGMSVMVEQMVWYYVRRQTFTVETLDRLFQFPSSVSLLRQVSLVAVAPLASVATLIVAITPFATVIAPTALTIIPANWKRDDITVPTIDLNAYDNLASIESGSGLRYLQPRIATKKTVMKSLLSQGVTSWPAPMACGASCRYTIEYFAPALKCEDKQLNMQGENPFWLLNITSHNATGPDPLSNDPTADSDLYTLGVAYRYLPTPDDGLADPPGNNVTLAVPGMLEYGSYCTVYNATYQADVMFLNNSQSTQLSVLNYLKPLNVSLKQGTFMDPTGSVMAELSPDTEYQPYSLASSFAIADAFAQALVGAMMTGTATDGQECLDITTAAPETGLFRVNDTNGAPCAIFLPSGPPNHGNVSQQLVTLFANVTTGFMDMYSVVLSTDPNSFLRLRQPTDTVNGGYRPDHNVYSYNPTVLLPTYAGLLVLDLVVSAAGIYCLKKNGIAGSFELSMLLSKTKDLRLGKLENR